jgi:hypothetical protein
MKGSKQMKHVPSRRPQRPVELRKSNDKGPRNALNRKDQTHSLVCPDSDYVLDNMRHWIVGCEVCALAFLAMLVLDATSHAQSVNHDSQFMTPFLAGPIPTKGPRVAERENPIISDLLRSSSEPTILLAGDSGRASLLSGADQSGFGTVIPLPVERYNLHLAEGSGETLWVGGYSKPSTSMVSKRLSYGYLAKVDRRGHLYWKREFGGQTKRRI